MRRVNLLIEIHCGSIVLIFERKKNERDRSEESNIGPGANFNGTLHVPWVCILFCLCVYLVCNVCRLYFSL